MEARYRQNEKEKLSNKNNDTIITYKTDTFKDIKDIIDINKVNIKNSIKDTIEKQINTSTTTSNITDNNIIKSNLNFDKINYIFLDLRLIPNDDNRNKDLKSGFLPGFIPKTIILDQSELTSDNVNTYCLFT